MNLGGTNNVTPFSENVSKSNTSPRKFPTRRSIRLRNSKFSADFCNADEDLKTNRTDSEKKEVLLEQSVQSIINGNQLNPREKDVTNHDPQGQNLKSNTFFQNETNETFEGIFAEKCKKSFKPLGTEKLFNETSKERKFFKRNSLEHTTNIYQNATSSKTILPTEDVSKVFKIISKQNVLSHVPTNSKSSLSSRSVKTYSNPRKCFQKDSVNESFGLPDHPITSNGIKPIVNDKLDVETLDASEITILDVKCSNEPWVITNMEGDVLFPYFEEVRIKAEPVKHECFEENVFFIDADLFETCEKCEDSVFTSTPISSKRFIKNELKYSNCTRIDKNLVLKNKEIDIEAIKLDFKKVLQKKYDEKLLPEDIQETKIRESSSPKKKNISKRLKNSKVNLTKEILFVQKEGLENQEFEFSKNMSVSENVKNYNFNEIKQDLSSQNLEICNDESTNPIKKINGNKLNSVKYNPRPSNSDCHTEENLKIDEKSNERLSSFNTSLIDSPKFIVNTKNKGMKLENRMKKNIPKNSQKTDCPTIKCQRILRSDLVKEKCLKSRKASNCLEENKEKIIQFDNSINTDGESQVLGIFLDSNCGHENSKTISYCDEHYNKNLTKKSPRKATNGRHKIACNDDNSENEKFGNTTPTQTSKLELIKRNLRSNDAVTSATVCSVSETNKNNESKEKSLDVTIIAEKRKLRSSSQENLQETISSKHVEKNIVKSPKVKLTKNKIFEGLSNSDVKVDIKVSLEKIFFKADNNIPIGENLQNHIGNQNSLNKMQMKNKKSPKHCVEQQSPKKSDMIIKESVEIKMLSNENEKVSALKDEKKLKISINRLDISGFLDEIPNVENHNLMEKSTNILPKKTKLCLTTLDDTRNQNQSVELDSTPNHDRENSNITQNLTTLDVGGNLNANIEVISYDEHIHQNLLCTTINTTRNNLKEKIVDTVLTEKVVIDIPDVKLKDNNKQNNESSKKVKLDLSSSKVLKQDHFNESKSSCRDIEITSNIDLSTEAENVGREDSSSLTTNCTTPAGIENSVIRIPSNDDEILKKGVMDTKISEINAENLSGTLDKNSSSEISNLKCINQTEIVNEPCTGVTIREEFSKDNASSNDLSLENIIVSNEMETEEKDKIFKASKGEDYDWSKKNLKLERNTNNIKLKSVEKISETADDELLQKTLNCPNIDFQVQLKSNKLCLESTNLPEDLLKQFNSDNNSDCNISHEKEETTKNKKVSNMETTIGDHCDNRAFNLCEYNNVNKVGIDYTFPLEKEAGLFEKEKYEVTDIIFNNESPKEKNKISQVVQCDSQNKQENENNRSHHGQSTILNDKSKKSTNNEDNELNEIKNSSIVSQSSSNLNESIISTLKTDSVKNYLENIPMEIVQNDSQETYAEVISEANNFEENLQTNEKNQKTDQSETLQCKETKIASNNTKPSILKKTTNIIAVTDNFHSSNTNEKINVEANKQELASSLNKLKYDFEKCSKDKTTVFSDIEKINLNLDKDTSSNKHMSKQSTNEETYDSLLKTSQSVESTKTGNRRRGRPPRRKSVDDIQLLNKNSDSFSKRAQRSRSVAPPNVLRRKVHDDESIPKIDLCEYMGTLTRSKSFSFGLNSIDINNPEIDDTLNLNKFSITQEKSLITTVKEIHSKGSINLGLVNRKVNAKSPVRDKYNFKVGDVAWAHIGSFPYWPCLVVKDPVTKKHKKTFQAKVFKRVSYHVRFFGDKGRRAWIQKSQMMLYNGKDDLNTLRNKLKDEHKPASSLQVCIVKTNLLDKWNCAVDEAEQIKSKTIKEKLSFFQKVMNSLEKKQKDILSEDTKSLENEDGSSIKNDEDVTTKIEEISSLKRKRVKITKEEVRPELATPLITENINEKSPSRKKFKKENLYKNDEKEIAAVSSKSENEAEIELIKNEGNEECENELTSESNQIKQNDENSDTESKTISENSLDCVMLYSMEAQKDLFKRNNLFKGISRDKVCQHCLKNGEVLKCKGRCNGSFHVQCATKILKERNFRKRKTISIGLTDSAGNEMYSKKTIFSVGNDNSMHENNFTLKMSNNEKDLILSDDDHVQIITVPSSMYNTPPRKTFPPDFKNMTLAEQIDFKMKEIMKKFESKTFYAELSAESNSDDNSLNLHRGFSTNIALLPTNNPTMNEKTNIVTDIKIDDIAKNISPVNTVNDLCKNISLSNSKQTLLKSKINNKTNKKRKKKLFTTHITADYDASENTESESSKSDITIENKINANEKFSDICERIDPKNFKCGFCISDLDPFCFICQHAVSKKGSNIRQKCSLYQCGRFYHPECLKMWPQTQWSLIHTTKLKNSDEDVDSFVCPLHVCHTCVSDDPRAATPRCSGDKIVKCLRCPSTYHSTNLCVPAGTNILSSTQILCPRHREKTKQYTINTTWCFLCSEGGNLVCCDTCPTSVHPECLPVNLTDDDKFICEDCESGRLPLYDEIVWVKLGQFRWWPGLILFPNEIPRNILNIKHSTGEFVVKFFGTYDHYWVNKGRSFLFQDGDTGHCNSTKNKVDAAFNRAVEEAVIAHKLKKEFKQSQEVEPLSSLKPPPYIRIKVNKPVGNVRLLDLDLSSTNACECDPSQPNPCGPDSDCLNRLLLTECSPDVCPAGKKCKNQSFEKREYPPIVPFKTQGRGWGLKTLALIKKGQFVIEYVGELIDLEEYQRRLQKMHKQKEENYYFLTIDKDRMLDAGPKGNVARFMNHCCQPNCETQKWTVNGDTRVGLFATEDIPIDAELTFNYNLECVGKEKKICRCGAPNCSGFIGVKAKQETDSKKPKKSYKKKKPQEPIILPPCFICNRRKNVVACNNKICNKAYHLRCLNITESSEATKFICPWHNCNICSKRTIRCCVKCVNSFCPSHSEGNVRYDNLLGFICSKHDPTNLQNNTETIKLKKNREYIITEETAVTSTTSDDADDDDKMPLLLRLKKYKKMKKKHLGELENPNICEVDASATSSLYCDYESQDESADSSASMTDVEDDSLVKKRRGRKPRDQTKMHVNHSKKKMRLSNVQSHKNTANLFKVDVNDKTLQLSDSHNELEIR